MIRGIDGIYGNNMSSNNNIHSNNMPNDEETQDLEKYIITMNHFTRGYTDVSPRPNSSVVYEMKEYPYYALPIGSINSYNFDEPKKSKFKFCCFNFKMFSIRNCFKSKK